MPPTYAQLSNGYISARTSDYAQTSHPWMLDCSSPRWVSHPWMLGCSSPRWVNHPWMLGCSSSRWVNHPWMTLVWRSTNNSAPIVQRMALAATKRKTLGRTKMPNYTTANRVAFLDPHNTIPKAISFFLQIILFHELSFSLGK